MKHSLQRSYFQTKQVSVHACCEFAWSAGVQEEKTDCADCYELNSPTTFRQTTVNVDCPFRFISMHPTTIHFSAVFLWIPGPSQVKWVQSEAGFVEVFPEQRLNELPKNHPKSSPDHGGLSLMSSPALSPRQSFISTQNHNQHC